MATSMAAAAAPSNRQLIGLDYDEQHLACSPTLLFSVGDSRYAPDATENARRLIAAVDTAVAARAADGPDVEALEASFVYDARYNHFKDVPMLCRGYTVRHDHAADITSAHLARWLRFAADRVTGSFVLSVPTVPPPPPAQGRSSGFVRRADVAAVPEIMELYAELPASARAETVSLTLGDAELSVPVAGAGAFSALTNLFLSQCRLDTGEDANQLGRMISSSCCPRLRRLRLEHVDGLHALRLEAAGTLEELRLGNINDMSVLQVHAPGLRSLHILNCTEISEVSISAPALDTLGCDFGMPPDRTEFTAAAGVRRLEKLYLSSHGFPPESESYSNLKEAWLLEQCTATESLDVGIWAPTPQAEDGGGTSELIGLLPHLPAVTDLSIEAWVTACLGPGHRLGHSVARLVSRCGGGSLRRLAVAFFNQYHEPCSDPGCFCNPPAPEMEVLEHLVEAKIVGYRPLPDQVSLVRALMAKAPALERMTVQFEYTSEDDGELPLPCDRGHWVRSAAACSLGQPVYDWTPADAAAL